MRNRLIAANFVLACIFGISIMSCTFDQNPNPPAPIPPGPPEPAYIGSDRCAACHADGHTIFQNTGHANVFQAPIEGGAPDYPYTSLAHLPTGYTWDDIAYVVGGYSKKANYVDMNGYLVTGNDAQWNFASGEAVAYHADMDAGTKMYDCGRCHTTGWVSIADGADAHMDMDGMGGDFAEAGVQCESCHGMGSVHASTQSPDDISKDGSAELCGSCHSRSEDLTNLSVFAEAGHIQNYQQYSEMKSSPHADGTCNTCHDPHVALNDTENMGIVKDCQECHSDIVNKADHRGATCTTCHMPAIGKSATAKNKYTADVMTHIFEIDPTIEAQMFNMDGTAANATDGIAIDYVCYQCHKDADGVGGDAFSLSRQGITDRATGWHE